jgi:hypothetical protein
MSINCPIDEISRNFQWFKIVKLLKPLKISQNFVYRAIKRYKELWGIEERAPSGRLKSVKAEAAIKTVGERIH